MKMRKLKNRIFNRKRKDHGATLIEMIVCFALLGIFMACASALITSITSIYYSIRGEIYSREVSDIVMEKIVSELDGAKYTKETEPGVDYGNPKISADHKSIDLYDKTDTRVILRKNNKDKLEIYYYPIQYEPGSADNRNATNWYFDDSVYNGFFVADLAFYRGGDSITAEVSTEYGLGSIDMNDYGDNVVLVLLKMNSEKYGVYHYHRFVRMANVDDTT